MKPVYVLKHAAIKDVPEGAKLVDWREICNRKDWRVVVQYSQYRSTSRWGSAPRARPYTVCGRHLEVLTSAKTLVRAVRAAQEYT
jgi:hypothetical protein